MPARVPLVACTATHLHPAPVVQTSRSIIVVGGAPRNGSVKPEAPVQGLGYKDDWFSLDSDICYWANALRPVQWYPGHIAKTEKKLKEQLKLMDVVIEVRNARIPLSTSHPQMDFWLGNRRRILVLNREDMISSEDRNEWASYCAKQGIKIIFSNGQLGMGSTRLSRLPRELAADVNIKRRLKGLLPRPVGRFGKDLELLDSPGIIPMRIGDQAAAVKLAICDDIGERSYDTTDIAAILVQILARVPSVGTKELFNRYKIETDGRSGQIFIHDLALKLFGGDTHQAAFRILRDFRKGRFGWISLEKPPR